MIALPVAWWMWCGVCTMMVRDVCGVHSDGVQTHTDGA